MHRAAHRREDRPDAAPSPKLTPSMSRLNHPVYRNRVLQVAADAALVALAYFLAFQLRFLDDTHGLPQRYETLFAQSVGFVVVGKLVDLRRLRALPEVVALRQRPRLPADLPRRRRRQRDPGRRLRRRQPFAHTLPRSVEVIDFLLTLMLIAGARLAVRLIVERPSRGRPRAEARGAGDRRRLRRPDGRPRAAAQPQPRRHRDRLRRRRPAQARDADAGAEGARLDPRDRADPRRDRARRGGDRDPLGAGHAARQGRRRLPRARDPRPHPADRVRAAARRRPAQQAAARGAGRGRARPRPDRARARPRRRLPARPHRPRHRRRRLDRLRALPPDRPGQAAAAGDARPRRGQPLRDRPRDGRASATSPTSSRCSPTARSRTGCWR